MPLVDQPKVKLHSENPPYVSSEQAAPYTIPLPPASLSQEVAAGATMNGLGRCNHMGGTDDVVVVSSTGNDGIGDTTIIQGLAGTGGGVTVTMTTVNGQESENGTVEETAN